MMMGLNDAIEFFAQVAQILDDSDIETDRDFPEKYTQAMNRFRYECNKSYGASIKRIKRVRESGYISRCGNCGSECLDGNPQYRFCPNCGYAIRRD